MENVFIGMIRAIPLQFVPEGWLECNGQTVSIQQYTALFGVLGFRYGGDQQTTFGLPDLRGRTIVGAGVSTVAGREVPSMTIGAQIGADTLDIPVAGTASLTIGEANLPTTQFSGALDISGLSATSTLSATTNGPGETAPTSGAMLSASGSGQGAAAVYFSPPAGATPAMVKLNDESVKTTLTGSATISATLGSGTAVPTLTGPLHAKIPTMQPSLGVMYIICYDGVYPSRP